MKLTIKLAVCLVTIFSLLAIVILHTPRPVHAQASASLIQVDYVQGPISGCQTHTGITTYCYGTDGFCFSKLGSAYGGNLALASTVSGVTSWNGLTGAVNYTPPVVSVQGKTGAVNLTVQ